ncbi:leucine-rich repeat and calponin homology domain-containing protein 4 isoform X2 [Amia ocellicauda]|uniref:leucine-rich repeat and calponin homology domain-containing protein 4 isoform X2 n=1 Tax=Amia ocellicauda TaxID=2972642 RepID=UPI003464946A
MAAGDDSPLPATIAASRSVEKAFEEAAASGALSLANRKLKEFPRTSRNFDLSDITHADLSKNRLSEVPEELCHLIALETLSLYHNCVRGITLSVCNLQALTYLNVSRNQLSCLPPSLCQLPLRVLIAGNNKLSCLPPDIQGLVTLRQLDVSCNELTALPTEIGQLESLRDLNLRRNHLTTLPEELAELPLVRLDVSCNRVTRVPVCYRHLRHLQTINLDNNPLQSPPAQICTKGKIHIFKYLNIEACSKTAPEEFERPLRPSGFNGCLSDQELFPARPYGGLDSGFNSVDSGSKRWSGNESTDDFSELSLRMAEISRDQRHLREERGTPAPVNGEVDQVDFIVGNVTEEEEEEEEEQPLPRRPSGCRPTLQQINTAHPQEKNEREGAVPAESADRSPGSRSAPGGDGQPSSPSPEERRRPETLQIWQERERAQQQRERRDSCLLKTASKTGSVSVATAAHTGSSAGGGSSDSSSSHLGLRQRSQSSDHMSSPAPQRCPGRTDSPPSQTPSVSTGGGHKPNSFLFRAQSRSNVKPTGSVHSLVDTGRCDSKPSLSRSPREDRETIAQLRKTLETRLKVTLADDLGEALSNGAVLCQLANHVRPRSVTMIHVPSPAVPKLSAAKCRLNVENFLGACRKLGVPEDALCPSQLILEDEGLSRIALTVQSLIDLPPPGPRRPSRPEPPPPPATT